MDSSRSVYMGNSCETCGSFIEILLEKLQELSRHHFVTKQQSEFLRKSTESIQLGEVIVIADFSENYAFILQDSIQVVHWRTIKLRFTHLPAITGQAKMNPQSLLIL